MNQTNIGDVHAGSAGESKPERKRRLQGTGERGRKEVQRWLDAGKNLGSQLDEQVQKRPYVAVGAAAGLGFVAGSLFGTRLGQLALALGIGYVVKSMLGERANLESLEAGLELVTGERGSID
ncbi:MAG: hypothetical protein FWD17_10050 [Polyangiaceae bacterium]|nr:hypothetical protein [Polyangiaceae bacterium]